MKKTINLLALLTLLIMAMIACRSHIPISSDPEGESVPKESASTVDVPSEITACGAVHPEKNLPWLAEFIEKAESDKTGHYVGQIWLEKFKEEDIFITDMMLGSGGVAYWYFDCSGNHFVSKEWGDEYCPACKFVGNHHAFMEDADFQYFILNMKKNIVIYSPY